MEGKKRGDRFRGGSAINRCSGASVFPFLADFIHSLPLLRLGKEIFSFSWRGMHKSSICSYPFSNLSAALIAVRYPFLGGENAFLRRNK
jgi:hypothetical protein